MDPVPEENGTQRNQRSPPPKYQPAPRNQRDPTPRQGADAPAKRRHRAQAQGDEAHTPTQKYHPAPLQGGEAKAQSQRSHRAQPQGQEGGAHGALVRPRSVQEFERPLRRESSRLIAGQGAAVVVDDPAYLLTEEYPFSADQLDVKREKSLPGGVKTDLAGNQLLPQMAPSSKTLLNMTPDVASTLEMLDLECAGKHLEAIKDSVATHDDLHKHVLKTGEEPVKVLDLAGLEDAPGLYDHVTQRCRMVFTNDNRLVFTQTKHSAEIGMPETTCLASALVCFQDHWSRRRWTSYCAVINASEILQVFVQQTLATSYQESNCTFGDICGELCCAKGGTMYSEKNIDGATQTLGDHDQGKRMSRWDKTRHMRHALVIRYLDYASNAVQQTTAMADPSTPASKLYEMAGEIEANITFSRADWLECKTYPTALPARPFRNNPPSTPLFKRTSYKALISVFFAVSLYFFAITPTSAAFMLIAVLVSVSGSYYSMRSQAQVTRQTKWAIFGNIPPALVGTQGVAVAVYGLSLLIAVRTQSYASALSGTPYV